MSVPVPEKLTKSEELDTLEAFARRVERQIVSANLKGQESMERLVCRLLTHKKTPWTVSATMAQRWVEWKYGKAKETLKVEGTVTHEHIDLSRLSNEQLEQIEKLVESANADSL